MIQTPSFPLQFYHRDTLNLAEFKYDEILSSSLHRLLKYNPSQSM